MKSCFVIFALIYHLSSAADDKDKSIDDKVEELKMLVLKWGANVCDPAEKDKALKCYDLLPEQGHKFVKKALTDGTGKPESTSFNDLLTAYCAKRSEINEKLALKYAEEWANTSEEKKKAMIDEAHKPENYEKYTKTRDCIMALKDKE